MRVPLATYRLQFSPLFRFNDARKLLPYLISLGITDIYASPVFKARSGSMHGYDVIDPTQINSELGSEAEFQNLLIAVQNHSLGWIQDIVPNHMAFDSGNEMLMDVLEHGQKSPFASFFDIDWTHPDESLHGRLLAPFLGRFYGDCLDSGEITLSYEKRGLRVVYFDLHFPLRIDSYARVFGYGLQKLISRLGPDHRAIKTLHHALDILKKVMTSGGGIDEEKVVRATLWELYTNNQDIRNHVDDAITTFNGRSGDPSSFTMLDSILSEQFYRLSFWKVATEEINYRRFFNINQLISVRVEDESVFRSTHDRIIRYVKEGLFTGLRVDHVDGLYDPLGYLKRLRNAVGDVYIVVEKILHHNEHLPTNWPIAGTTGYDFLHHANALFCDTKNEKKITRIYKEITGSTIPFDTLAADTKRFMIGKHMAGDVDRLARILKSTMSKERYGSDFTIYGLRRALVEILASFPVYRTYIDAGGSRDEDRRVIEKATHTARESYPALAREIDFIGQFLLFETSSQQDHQAEREWLHVIMRFQQLTGPLMAKGFEDTALYVYHRLVSLNEVGCDPSLFGLSPKELHQWNIHRARHWPLAMSATSTHDTKRGADVRARIHTISELPDEWRRRVRGWMRMNRDRKTSGQGEIPDRNDEYLFYQTLVGIFTERSELPSLTQRMTDYMIKAVREAKIHTAWIKPDERYENGFVSFIQKVLKPDPDNTFLEEVIEFTEQIAAYGILNSLSQTLLKITAPGVPDIYQGSEFWEFSLVDPDNRRPVDYQKRTTCLRELINRSHEDISSLIEDLLTHRRDGRVKQFLIWRALRTRLREDLLFTRGSYIPINTVGERKDNLFAFARVFNGSWTIAAVPRRVVSLIAQNDLPVGQAVWEDTSIQLPREAPTRWRDVFSGRIIDSKNTLRVSELLKTFPVGFLVAESSDGVAIR
jgi:(1->4)-alpha-D-glucan 1-alpha-D-glucosylmutase